MGQGDAADTFETHGRILCGTVHTPAFADSLADYTGPLGLRVVEQGVVAPALAAAWGALGHAGRRWALLHGGGRPGYVRLVEGEATRAPPMTTHGWAAFEMTVRDVHALHARLAGSQFAVIGPPGQVGDFTTFIPFQVAGRAGEVLYLNQVLTEGAGMLDLPFATADVDHIFITVLGAPDRAAALAFHRALGFGEAETYTFPIGVVNRANGLAEDHQTTLTMTCAGRLPASEIDQFPPSATPRPVAEGFLPPGNAMVTFAVRALPEGRTDWLGEPVRMPGPLYRGRRSACVRGTAGEIIELVELGG
jgi:hypothetical protein